MDVPARRRYAARASHWWSDLWLRLIAFFKLLKATLLVGAGIGALGLLNPHFAKTITGWATALAADRHYHLLDSLVSYVVDVDERTLALLSVGSFLYAMLFYTEGFGLFFDRRWAEFLTIVDDRGLDPVRGLRAPSSGHDAEDRSARRQPVDRRLLGLAGDANAGRDRRGLTRSRRGVRLNPLAFEPIAAERAREIGATLEAEAFQRWIGLRFEEIRLGYARVRLPHRPELLQGGGVVHGGAIASAIDSVVIGAVFSLFAERPRRAGDHRLCTCTISMWSSTKT